MDKIIRVLYNKKKHTDKRDLEKQIIKKFGNCEIVYYTFDKNNREYLNKISSDILKSEKENFIVVNSISELTRDIPKLLEFIEKVENVEIYEYMNNMNKCLFSEKKALFFPTTSNWYMKKSKGENEKSYNLVEEITNLIYDYKDFLLKWPKPEELKKLNRIPLGFITPLKRTFPKVDSIPIRELESYIHNIVIQKDKRDIDDLMLYYDFITEELYEYLFDYVEEYTKGDIEKIDKAFDNFYENLESMDKPELVKKVLFEVKELYDKCEMVSDKFYKHVNDDMER